MTASLDKLAQTIAEMDDGAWVASAPRIRARFYANERKFLAAIEEPSLDMITAADQVRHSYRGEIIWKAMIANLAAEEM
jgi:hypothetical protein